MRPNSGPYPTETLHATCVALDGRGVLILGASGAGKSALGLELMAYGARLVADDRTIISRAGDHLIATCPPKIRGLIEARGIGLLAADPVAQARVTLIVDLDQFETDRLPPKRQRSVLGLPIDLVFGATSRHFPFGILQVLRASRIA
ncbi:HPr kinase/phosphorylase [Pseudorhodobacter ferrugineus]|uniref:HPr kinase/phosphorylase n=1 Tax=Pseudorhodobacter ferrugineus TaxID=77008 RepID=UPI0003B371F5|nr:HPr kinase/phosphatase C-terminal domain-containing protein [Pseudorhodobacter ferrugineus]